MGTDWFSDATATFGDRLAGAREHAGMTQGQLARRVGVKLGTLKHWEEDLSEPRANKLQLLSGLLGVSLGWLLTGEGEGIEAPEEIALADDVDGLLIELRQLRSQMLHLAERTGVIEKQLRARLKEGPA